ncbi:MAG: trypsin-like peptidase domain-containing protein [Nocardioidaceae bacterium]
MSEEDKERPEQPTWLPVEHGPGQPELDQPELDQPGSGPGSPDPGSSEETEPTRVIETPETSWSPPHPQPYPPYPPAYPVRYPQQPGYPGAAQLGSPPEPAGSHLRERRSGPPGWMWPLVAALALVVGALGGALGGAIVAGNSSDVIALGGDNGDSDAAKAQSAPLPATNGSIAAVAEELLPSTVQVNADGGSDQGGATGSGFVYDRAGHVITNNHVVRDATGPGELTVLDVSGISHKATIVGRSTVYDLAVLEVDKASHLKPASIGSSDLLRIGDGVVAIGSPLGLSSTVTSGIVSALNRPVTTGENQDFSYINAVQTDAAINPGNSGGPLVNMRGQVVGVNSAIATTGSESGSIGVGFAIPMKQVRITAGQILDTGEATYPIIGASVTTQPGVAGAQITSIPDGSPAGAAGLREGDVVVAVNGQRVTNQIEMIVAIRTHEPGQTITLSYLRDGDLGKAKVTLEGETETLP